MLEGGWRQPRIAEGYCQTLLRFATWVRELAVLAPPRVPWVKLPETIIKAWTPEEVAKLRAAGDQAKTRFAD